ncbi:hypothetical protein R1flu_007634 [Riccia fluitans]|uniref:Uncharacterized protein n=1 Tax=Riccia fluitans TaxID=41844 RepID=A0ABD1YZE2_9MARC
MVFMQYDLDKNSTMKNPGENAEANRFGPLASEEDKYGKIFGPEILGTTGNNNDQQKVLESLPGDTGSKALDAGEENRREDQETALMQAEVESRVSKVSLEKEDTDKELVWR